MSVHRELQGDGATVFIVRWRQGGRNRSKRFNPRRFGSKRNAERAARDYEAMIARAQALGDVDILDRGRVTFADYVEGWWDRYATRRLAESTIDSYAGILDRFVIPQWGAWMLREITPKAIEDWIAQLHDAEVGDPTILRSLAVMSGVLKRAVVDQELNANPVAAVDKPRQRRKRDPRPLDPFAVERIRAWFLERDLVGDATLISLLAYAGPRPESEAITLEWPQVRRHTLLLRASKKHGEERPVRLLAPLAEDLAAWRRAGGTDVVRVTGLVFPFGRNGVDLAGGAWSGDLWDNWRTRRFRPAALAAGLPRDTRPRDLRGSFATLLIYEGQPVTYVAEQLGNSAAVCLRDYAGVFDDFTPADRVDADEAIRRAREAVRMGSGTGDEKAAER